MPARSRTRERAPSAATSRRVMPDRAVAAASPAATPDASASLLNVSTGAAISTTPSALRLVVERRQQRRVLGHVRKGLAPARHRPRTSGMWARTDPAASNRSRPYRGSAAPRRPPAASTLDRFQKPLAPQLRSPTPEGPRRNARRPGSATTTENMLPSARRNAIAQREAGEATARDQNICFDSGLPAFFRHASTITERTLASARPAKPPSEIPYVHCRSVAYDPRSGDARGQPVPRPLLPNHGANEYSAVGVIGQALVAACRTVDIGNRPPHSLHAYFLLGGDPKVPIIYDVDRIRDGKSYATRRVVAIQHGQAIFSMSVSFHVCGGRLHPSKAPDARCPEAGSVTEMTPRFRTKILPKASLKPFAVFASGERPILLRPVNYSGNAGTKAEDPNGIIQCLDSLRRRAARQSGASPMRARLRVRYGVA